MVRPDRPARCRSSAPKCGRPLSSSASFLVPSRGFRTLATATPSTTPNPNAMKFTLDVSVPDMVNASSADSAAGQPLAEALFALPGVVGVFATGDFVTVSKSADAEWDAIVPAVVDVLATAL